jgi:hypothetical protein
VGVVVQKDVALLAFDQSEDIDVVVHVDHSPSSGAGGGRRVLRQQGEVGGAVDRLVVSIGNIWPVYLTATSARL